MKKTVGNCIAFFIGVCFCCFGESDFVVRDFFLRIEYKVVYVGDVEDVIVSPYDVDYDYIGSAPIVVVRRAVFEVLKPDRYSGIRYLRLLDPHVYQGNDEIIIESGVRFINYVNMELMENDRAEYLMRDSHDSDGVEFDVCLEFRESDEGWSEFETLDHGDRRL